MYWYSRGYLIAYCCVFQDAYKKEHTYYLFNHVDLTIIYHSGENEEWGDSFHENGGRIIGKSDIRKYLICDRRGF